MARNTHLPHSRPRYRLLRGIDGKRGCGFGVGKCKLAPNCKRPWNRKAKALFGPDRMLGRLG